MTFSVFPRMWLQKVKGCLMVARPSHYWVSDWAWLSSYAARSASSLNRLVKNNFPPGRNNTCPVFFHRNVRLQSRWFARRNQSMRCPNSSPNGGTSKNRNHVSKSRGHFPNDLPRARARDTTDELRPVAGSSSAVRCPRPPSRTRRALGKTSPAYGQRAATLAADF